MTTERPERARAEQLNLNLVTLLGSFYPIPNTLFTPLSLICSSFSSTSQDAPRLLLSPPLPRAAVYLTSGLMPPRAHSNHNATLPPAANVEPRPSLAHPSQVTSSTDTAATQNIRCHPQRSQQHLNDASRI